LLFIFPTNFPPPNLHGDDMKAKTLFHNINAFTDIKVRENKQIQ
jgi:hypothetical protein